MDGVIVDSNPYHKIAFQAFLKQYNISLTDDELKVHVYGRTNQEGMPYIFKRELSPDRFFYIERMAWLPDKSALLLSARKDLAANNQLWRVSYPGMEIRQITEDLVSYLDLSVASDVDKVVASKTTRISDIWVGLSNDPGNLKKITQAIDQLCWTPDGRLVYTSTATGNPDLWIARPDGTEQRQLTNNAGTNRAPAVTFTESPPGLLEPTAPADLADLAWTESPAGSGLYYLAGGPVIPHVPADVCPSNWELTFNRADITTQATLAQAAKQAIFGQVSPS